MRTLFQVLTQHYSALRLAPEPDKNAEIYDDGTGAKIVFWNHDELGEQPTAEQIAAWQAEPEPTPRSQPTRRVLDRLTDAEYTALLDSPVVAIKRAVDAARSEGTISESDPLFSSFVVGCDSLGIISASRWDDLLAD